MEIQAFQMQAFEDDGWRRFENEMVDHITKFSPILSSVLGRQPVYSIVRLAIQRSASHGFTNRGPIRLFIELMFLCGGSFDTDPQFFAICVPLRESGNQMLRAQRMHEEHSSYLENVSGSKSVNVRQAFEELMRSAQNELIISAKNIEADLLGEFHRVFANKTAYAGDRAMRVLIKEAMLASSRYGFTTVRQITLVATLMFAFGHGCTSDPLYPWIEATLQDAKITSTAARALSLETKALTWLERMRANADTGSKA